MVTMTFFRCQNSDFEEDFKRCHDGSFIESDTMALSPD